MKNSKKSTIAILGGWDEPEDNLYDDEPEEQSVTPPTFKELNSWFKISYEELVRNLKKQGYYCAWDLMNSTYNLTRFEYRHVSNNEVITIAADGHESFQVDYIFSRSKVNSFLNEKLQEEELLMKDVYFDDAELITYDGSESFSSKKLAVEAFKDSIKNSNYVELWFYYDGMKTEISKMNSDEVRYYLYVTKK